MEPLPPTVESDLDLRHYLGVLWRRRWLILGCTLLFAAVALVPALTSESRYRATGELLVTAPTSFPGEGQQLPSTAERAVANEIEIIGSAAVTEAVAELVDGDIADVSAGGKGETDLIVLSAESTDPERAADSVNAYADAYAQVRRQQQNGAIQDEIDRNEDLRASTQQQLDDLLVPLQDLDQRILATPPGAEQDQLVTERLQLEQGIAGSRDELFLALADLDAEIDRLSEERDAPSAGVRVLNEAQVPTEPFAPSPRRDTVVAGGAGLLVGIGLAFAWENLDDRIRDRRGLEQAADGVPVLSEIPLVPAWRKETATLSLAHEPDSPPAEAYRSLLTNIDFLDLGERPVIQLTSPLAGEGKTTTVANLAVALAEGGRRCVVVEADLRRPQLCDLFHLDADRGLSTVLSGTDDVAEVVRATSVSNVDLLAAGPVPPNPTVLLRTGRLGDALAKLRETYDVVLVDTPPIIPVTDGLLVARLVDGVIVVVAAKDTRARKLRRTLEDLGQARIRAVGLVLNAVPRSASDYRYGYEPAGAGTAGR